jgi:hypothetical protein
MDKFVFVFDEQVRDKLLTLNYSLLQEQEVNNKRVYVFENKTGNDFSLCDFSKSDYILGNTLFF